MFRGDEPLQAIYRLRDLGYKHSQWKSSPYNNDHSIKLTDEIDLDYVNTNFGTQFISITKKLRNGLRIIYQEDMTSISSNLFFISEITENDDSGLDFETDIEQLEELKQSELFSDFKFRGKYGFQVEGSIKYNQPFELCFDLSKYVDDEYLLRYFSGNKFIKRCHSPIQPQFIDLPIEMI